MNKQQRHTTQTLKFSFRDDFKMTTIYEEAANGQQMSVSTTFSFNHIPELDNDSKYMNHVSFTLFIPSI